MKKRGGQSAGPAVDRGGSPVIDPTENVKALQEASNKRQDDLRAMSDMLNKERIDHLRDVVRLRAEHAAKSAELETSRLNAIRQVDVSGVTLAADRAITLAETVRSTLTTTAAQIAAQTANTVNIIVERIAALEKSSYESSGKQGVVDPMMGEMLRELKQLREDRSASAGKQQATDPVLLEMVQEIKSLRVQQSQGVGSKEGSKTTISYIALAISCLVGLIAIFGFIAMLAKTP